MEREFQKVADNVEKLLREEFSGHDFYHALRVYNSSLTIQETEGGDRKAIGLAALVHDVCRPWEKETGKSHFGPEALEKIKELLEASEVNSSTIDAVLEIVRLHDIYDWSNPENKSIELKVVQDADNLDAMGAIGIARAFAFGGAHNVDVYVPDENLNFQHDFIDDPKHRTSTVAHFYEKLLKLKDNMNTDTGKSMAEIRHQRMVKFLDDFFDEWKGNS